MHGASGLPHKSKVPVAAILLFVNLGFRHFRNINHSAAIWTIWFSDWMSLGHTWLKPSSFLRAAHCSQALCSVAQSIWRLEAACIIWAAESGPGTAHPNPVVVPQQGMRKPRFRSLYYLFSKLLTTLAKSHNSSFKVLKRNKIDVITFLADQKKKKKKSVNRN